MIFDFTGKTAVVTGGAGDWPGNCRGTSEGLRFERWGLEESVEDILAAISRHKKE